MKENLAEITISDICEEFVQLKGFKLMLTYG